MSDKREIISKFLTKREAEFYLAWLAGATLGEAHAKAWPLREPKDRSASGWQVMRRIKRKLGTQDFQRRLEEANLGETTLYRKLTELLEAERVEFYQGKAVVDQAGNPLRLSDNTTRARMVELLAELLSLRKGQLDIRHSGPNGEALLPRVVTVRLIRPEVRDGGDGGA